MTRKRPTIWLVLGVFLVLGPWGVLWDFGPRQAACLLNSALWAVAPLPPEYADAPLPSCF